MKRINNKGFAVSIILYSIATIICLVLILVLSVISGRIRIGNDTVDSIKNGLLSSGFDIGKEYSYIGDYQTFTADATGYYKFELWGASGGDITGDAVDQNNVSRGTLTYNGGNGAYTSGEIYLEKGTVLYIYVGGQGGSNTFGVVGNETGGYNGGSSIKVGQSTMGSPGGGATDIRTLSGEALSFDSLKSRIMVAAGGGGASFRNLGYGEGNGGAGGTLFGNNGEEALTTGSYFRTDFAIGYNIGLGGTQTSGGYVINYALDGSINEINTNLGGFGYSKQLTVAPEQGNIYQVGSGAGYYSGSNSAHGGAGGGSSFISGYRGCNAITETSTEDSILHTNSSLHYSNYKFENGVMISGNSSMPGYVDNNSIVGNDNNGHAKVTFIGKKISEVKATYNTGTKDMVSAIYFNPIDNVLCTEEDYTNNTEKLGKTGCLKWYSIENSDSSKNTVDVILDHNTTEKVKYNSTGVNTLAKEAKTQLTTDINGWNDLIKASARFITAQEVANITDNRIFNPLTFNSSRWFFLDTNKQDAFERTKGTSKYAWLYDYTDGCEALGCNTQMDNYMGYYTSTPVANSTTTIWCINSGGALNIDNVTYLNYGIRPVITITK